MSTKLELPRRTILTASLATAAVGALAGCGFSGKNPGSGGGGDGGGGRLVDTLRQANRPCNHLNPAFGGGGSPQSTWLMSLMWEGLINRDPLDASKYIPAVAEEWEASDDGLTYTFHLRKDAKWSNGEPLTAQHFVWSFSYYYSPDLAKQGNQNPPSHNGSVTSTKIVGMADYYSGKVTDFSTVGVKAPDDQTLVITLTEPDYKFLDGMISMYPLDQKSVEANPKDFWLPENLVSNGPYSMTAYSQNSTASFELNKSYYDAAEYTVTKREVQFNSGGPTAMMVNYNADEIDLFRVDGDPGALIAGRPDLEQQLQAASMIQYKGLTVLPCQNPILQENAKLREALSLALDRDALAKVSPPDAAAQSWAPPGIGGWDGLPKLEFNEEKAKQLISDAGFPDGKGVPELQIVTYQAMPFLEAVVSMWQKTLGIKASVAVQEVGVYTETIYGNIPKDFTGFGFDYNGIAPPSMLSLVGGNFKNYAFVSAATGRAYFDLVYGKDKGKYSPAETSARAQEILAAGWLPEYKEFDAQAKAAVAAQTDPDKSLELAIKAATTMQNSYLFMPTLWAGYSFMIKPRVKGLQLSSISTGMFSLKGIKLESA